MEKVKKDTILEFYATWPMYLLVIALMVTSIYMLGSYRDRYYEALEIAKERGQYLAIAEAKIEIYNRTCNQPSKFEWIESNGWSGKPRVRILNVSYLDPENNPNICIECHKTH